MTIPKKPKHHKEVKTYIGPLNLDGLTLEEAADLILYLGEDDERIGKRLCMDYHWDGEDDTYYVVGYLPMTKEEIAKEKEDNAKAKIAKQAALEKIRQQELETLRLLQEKYAGELET